MSDPTQSIPPKADAVEEAFREHERSIQELARFVAEQNPEATQRAFEFCHAAARAYGLAVLAEAIVGARYAPHSKAAWITAIRARLEAL